MNFSLSPAKHSKIGTCPHGLPAGACPICSGMGGGGGSAKTKSTASNEMSWDECFAVGQMLKAQRLAQQERNNAYINSFQSPSFSAKVENFSQNIANFAEKVAIFAQKATNLPGIISKPLNFIATKMLIPMLNILKDIPQVIQKTINFVKEKFADISDKLNAVFGELKNSIEKKISDRFNSFKKKAMSLFGLVEPQNVDDEERKIENAKRTFELKTVFENIKNLLKKQEQFETDD